MLFDYDDSDIKSIFNYAKKLEGMTYNEILNEFNNSQVKKYVNYKENPYMVADSGVSYQYEVPSEVAKGQLGTFLERFYFGYHPNSRQEADFPKVGVELKQTPVDYKNGKYVAGERLSITNISYEEPIEDDFYKSHVWQKIQCILLVQYVRNKQIERLDYVIKFVNMFSPPKEDLQVMVGDYHVITNKIKQGKAHELSEADTMYLGACTKGATAEKSWQPQYYGEHILAKKRNFCFKLSYMKYVVDEYVLKDNVPCESILPENFEGDLKTLIINKLNNYIGKTDKEICEMLGREYNNNKAQWSDLTFKMLGIEGDRVAEFEKANIAVKTIRIEDNNTIKESMSFSPFKFSDLSKEDWEDSKLYNYFDEKQLLFVLYKKQGDCYILSKVKLWHMPYEDLNVTLKNEWEAYKRIINEGVTFNIDTLKSGKTHVENNLPGMADTQIIHMRPHAKKSAYKLNNGFVYGDIKRDGDQLPNGDWMTKQSFWLNSKYVLKQISEDL